MRMLPGRDGDGIPALNEATGRENATRARR